MSGSLEYLLGGNKYLRRLRVGTCEDASEMHDFKLPGSTDVLVLYHQEVTYDALGNQPIRLLYLPPNCSLIKTPSF